MRAKIRWRNDADGHLVTCEEEFRHALAEAEQDAAHRPLIADVILDNGDRLSIALGRDVSVLSYRGASQLPPYLSSQGRKHPQDASAPVFHYFGHWTEFPPSSTIPTPEALEAARHFCTQGTLPPSITWTEV